MIQKAKDDPILSIIIPVFNMARYVARCLRSILEQDFIDYELIIIDDGSNDDTANVIRQFPDSRIHLISTANHGVSHARNRGIHEAKGLFLLFIDADDYISPGYIHHIMEEVETHEADIYIWGLTKDRADDNQKSIIPKVRGLLQRDVFLHEMVQEQYARHQGMMGYIANKLVRREWVLRHNLRFKPGQVLMEDYDFFLSCYNHVQTAFFFDESGYHYVAHPSTTGPQRPGVDYLSLIDTHRRCMLLTQESSHSNEDYRLVLQAIGKLSIAMFLELRPVTLSQVRQLMAEIERPWCDAGLRIIHPKQRRLQQLLLKKRVVSAYLYLKFRLLYFSLRRSKA